MEIGNTATVAFEGLELLVHGGVYEPAEDSFLLAKYARELRGRILDLGCGCGIQSLVCARADQDNQVIGVDANPDAVWNSIENAQRNGLENAIFLESSLFSTVENEKFDAIIFNPPYLPTSEEEKVAGNLNLAFDGGPDGRKVTDAFLLEFPDYLARNGTLLMIESSLAGIEKTMEKLGGLGFEARILEEEKFFFERIVAIRAQRK